MRDRILLHVLTMYNFCTAFSTIKLFEKIFEADFKDIKKILTSSFNRVRISHEDYLLLCESFLELPVTKVATQDKVVYFDQYTKDALIFSSLEESTKYFNSLLFLSDIVNKFTDQAGTAHPADIKTNFVDSVEYEEAYSEIEVFYSGPRYFSVHYKLYHGVQREIDLT